jgi:Xaa-Pro aminopeptidase
MKQNDLDALLVTDEKNYLYLTGHRTWNYAIGKSRPICLILPRDSEPVIIITEHELPTVLKTSWVRRIRARKPEDYDLFEHYQSPAKSIKEVILDLGLAKGRIGAELGAEQWLAMPYNDFRAVEKELPSVSFVDASNVFWDLRMIKSKAEVERIRKANETASRAIERCFSDVRQGMSEKEVSRKLSIYMLEEGADGVAFMGVVSGEKYDMRSPAVNRYLKSGDTVLIDFGSIYDGYCCDINRCATVGTPSQEKVEIFEAVLKATRICVDAVKPNIPISDILRTCETVAPDLTKHLVSGRIGHGVGLSVAEPPSVDKKGMTLLKPGMVIAIEPHVKNSLGYFSCEENVLVTQDGHEILTTADRRLFVIPS